LTGGGPENRYFDGRYVDKNDPSSTIQNKGGITAEKLFGGQDERIIDENSERVTGIGAREGTIPSQRDIHLLQGEQGRTSGGSGIRGLFWGLYSGRPHGGAEKWKDAGAIHGPIFGRESHPSGRRDRHYANRGWYVRDLDSHLDYLNDAERFAAIIQDGVPKGLQAGEIAYAMAGKLLGGQDEIDKEHHGIFHGGTQGGVRTGDKPITLGNQSGRFRDYSLGTTAIRGGDDRKASQGNRGAVEAGDRAEIETVLRRLIISDYTRRTNEYGRTIDGRTESQIRMGLGRVPSLSFNERMDSQNNRSVAGVSRLSSTVKDDSRGGRNSFSYIDTGDGRRGGNAISLGNVRNSRAEGIYGEGKQDVSKNAGGNRNYETVSYDRPPFPPRMGGENWEKVTGISERNIHLLQDGGIAYASNGLGLYPYLTKDEYTEGAQVDLLPHQANIVKEYPVLIRRCRYRPGSTSEYRNLLTRTNTPTVGYHRE